ncbi:MAG TPA: hypothetical protein VFQ72_03475 [Candidatus Paceibacterota bacterium]|nr:hypothetical protein [Candidatus Paceibacterota bacterium]
MKNLTYLSAFLALAVQALLAADQGIMRKLEPWASYDKSKLMFSVPARSIPEVSYSTERSMQSRFAVRHSDARVEAVVPVQDFESRVDSSPFIDFSLRASELKKLKNGIEIPGLGTVYSEAGARWRVDKDDPNLTRAIGTYHGGATWKQSYQWKDEDDLYRKGILEPFKRLALRIASWFD